MGPDVAIRRRDVGEEFQVGTDLQRVPCRPQQKYLAALRDDEHVPVAGDDGTVVKELVSVVFPTCLEASLEVQAHQLAGTAKDQIAVDNWGRGIGG